MAKIQKTTGNGPLKWLITGGCGFIGTRLINGLVSGEDNGGEDNGKRGHQIRVLDNLTVGTRDDLARVASVSEAPGKSGDHWPAAGVTLIPGDIKDAETCHDAARGADVIVHLAANTGVGPSVEDPAADMRANVIGTFNMLEAARHNGTGRFIFASSGAPAGECEPPIHEELAPHPVSPYGASKLAGEGYCSAYAATFGVETVALRFGNVYGPGSGHKNSVVAKFIKNAFHGEPLEIYGDGNQTRDFIFIDDLIRAIRLAAVQPGIGGQTFQIATSMETTVGELVERLVPVLEAIGKSGIQVIHGESRTGDVRRNYADTAKAARLLNWQSEYSLEDGLRETVAYFVENSKKR
ncbi:MAG: NAD-dependent epimerase/dehydratase family protein [Thermodesulfobacteriota bacterium]|nr:NAD-dependent epimerase/dehydratase family protein [Thermodesulfobacteriota bacterium]